MTRTSFNYWLDIVIGLAFIASPVTGVAFLFMGTGGYEGGRNLAYEAAFLGIAREAWRSFHTFASFVMTVGVGYHLAYHFGWIVSVTGSMLPVRGMSLPVQEPDAVREAIL